MRVLSEGRTRRRKPIAIPIAWLVFLAFAIAVDVLVALMAIRLWQAL